MNKIFTLCVAIFTSLSATMAQTNVSGTINANTTWNLAGSPYTVTGNIIVNTGFTLTVDSNVIVKFQTNTGLQVRGSLNAKGVKFTSAQASPKPADWNSIQIGYSTYVGSGFLRNCIIEYGGVAGAYNSYSALSVENGTATVDATEISKNNNGGLQVFQAGVVNLSRSSLTNNVWPVIYQGSGTINYKAGNLYTGNTHNAALIDFASTSTPFYLYALDIPYVFLSNFTVSAGGTLEIASGNTVKMADYTSILINGSFKAIAGTGKNIYFTSYRNDNLGGDSNANGTANVPSASNWGSIQFNPTSIDAQCTMKRCNISFGGYSVSGAVSIENASPTIDSCDFNNNYDGAQFIGVSKPNFRYNTIASSTRVPVAMTFDADPVFLNNTFSFSDNEYDAIGLLQGTLAENSVLKQRDITGIPNVTYVMLGTLTIPENISLIINKGIVIKGFSSAHRFIVKGTLVADGKDAANRVVITSVKDDNHGNPMDTNKDGTQTTPSAGDWGGMVFEATASDTSKINFCRLKYGQTPSVYYNTRYIGGGTLTTVNASPIITNNLIQNMQFGIYAFQVSNPLIQNNEFSNSTQTPVAISVSADPVFAGNTFVNCGWNALGIIGEKLGFNGAIKKRNVAGFTNITNLLLEDLTVNSGTNMDINSGVVLKCNSGTSIYVDGGFRIMGTATDTVILTSVKDDNYGNPKDTQDDGDATSPANGNWGTINFRASANDAYNIINYSGILYGGSYSQGGITFTDAGGQVENTIISNSSFNGIRCEGASTPICTNNVEIKNCTSDPIAMSLKANPTFSFAGMKMNSNGNGSNGIRIIEGTLSSDASLIKRDVGGVYNIAYIVDQLTISPDATLTISPGVVIKFLNYYSGITVNGALVANGLKNNKIVFTSISDDSKGGDTNDNGNTTNPARGNWFSIVFNASAKDNSNVLKNCILNYGGSAPYNYYNKQDGIVRVFDAKLKLDSCMLEQSASAAVGIFGSATPAITNNEINNITRTPVTMSMFSNPTFLNNTISNIGIIALGIAQETYSLDATIPIRNFAGYNNITYYMYNASTINSGTKITIPSGVVFKSNNNSFFVVNGGIKVNGTSAQPVIFTHESDDAYGSPMDSNNDGDLSKPTINSSYYGIDFADISNDSSYVNNAIFKYQHAGVNLQQASPRVANSTFEKCNWGVVLRGVSAPKVDTCKFNNLVYSPIIISLVSYPSSTAGNVVTGSTYKAIGVLSEELVQDVTLTKRNFAGITNIPYYFSGNYTIGTSVVLTINPGVVCKFNGWANLLVKRGLMAQGGSTADSTIVFTSVSDDYYSGDSNSDGKKTVPGGYGTSWRGITFDNQALDNMCKLKHCVIKYAGYYSNESAITTESASPAISYCHITNNKNGLRATGASNPVINYSDIYSNEEFGVNNVNPSYTINAKYNYWGSNTGPTHTSNPAGTGDKVSSFVDYGNFLTINKPVMGDVSLNGFVQAYDASLILQHVISSIVLQPKQLKVADVSDDGSVSAFDASLILQYMAGSILNFPAELKSYKLSSLPGNFRFNLTETDNSTLVLAIEGIGLSKVSSFEMELTYNASAVSAKELLASLLTNDMIRVDKIDNLNGSIKFAFAGNNFISTDGVLANLTFNKLSTETANITVVSAKLNETGIIQLNQPNLNNLTDNNKKLSVFPNPAKDKVKVSFTAADGNEITVLLYNSKGQLVGKTNKGSFAAGRHTVDVNLQELGIKPGLYYLKVNNETISVIIP